MSKNIDRKSLSKFPKNFIKQSDLLRYDFQKIIRSQQKIYSQRKVRSSQKNQQVRNNQTIEEGLTTKYKKSSVNKNRIKTEMDQEPIKNNSHRISFYEKNPYQKLIGFKRKKINGNQDLLNKFEAESKFKQYQTLINDQHKNKDHNKRKAFFLGQINCNDLLILVKNLTRSSKEKYDFPLTGKNFNNNKKNQRLETSEKKKINIQKYTSESLEKLKMADQKIKVCDDPKKKNEKTIEKYRKIYNNLIAEETISDIKEKSNQKFDEQAQDQLRTKSHLYQQKRKRKTQHDDQQNYQIVFQKSKKNQKKNNTNPFDLSREQMETFGDRFPQSFQKIKLLGRGGFSLVWLGQHKKSKKQFAIKQIKTQNNHQTHIKEIWFGTYFFQMGGNPKKQFAKHIGIKNLVKIYSYDINKNDTWIFYQKCGESLGNALYELKGETKNNQRVYRVLGNLQTILFPSQKQSKLNQENYYRSDSSFGTPKLTQNRSF